MNFVYIVRYFLAKLITVLTSALKCVSLAAQKLRRMFVSHTHTWHKEPKEIEETAILNTITINNPNEMIGVTDKNKKNMAYFWKQDGDCKIRRAQKQLKQPRIEICKLKQVENDSKNNIIPKNRWNKQLPRRKKRSIVKYLLKITHTNTRRFTISLPR